VLTGENLHTSWKDGRPEVLAGETMGKGDRRRETGHMHGVLIEGLLIIFRSILPQKTEKRTVCLVSFVAHAGTNRFHNDSMTAA